MTEIHRDHNNVRVLAQTPLGHVYTIAAGFTLMNLMFQNGPIKEVGVNGITNEALIAILIHRIGILNTQFPCEENVMALASLTRAQQVLLERTQSRMARGVEGKSEA
jgi:hypothetical protein